jgi:hypothetical protein
MLRLHRGITRAGAAEGGRSERTRVLRELGLGSIPLFCSSMGDRMPPPFKMHMDTWFQNISSGCLRLLLIYNSTNAH